MKAEDAPMKVKAIGVVRNEVREPGRRDWQEVTSEIVFEEGLEQSLEGLEEFSHILVVYWMHRLHPGEGPWGKIHPMGRADLPLVGLFATRTPHRPNPLGVAVVRLLERRGNALKVVGLDAIDGTPVIDVKPFIPPLDFPSQVRVPQWVKRLK